MKNLVPDIFCICENYTHEIFLIIARGSGFLLLNLPGILGQEDCGISTHEKIDNCTYDQTPDPKSSAPTPIKHISTHSPVFPQHMKSS
jgi:hypothetical protein